MSDEAPNLGSHPERRPLEIVRPTFPPTEDIFPLLARAFQEGRVTNNGPHVQEFEQALERFMHVPTLAFSSGQTALMVLLRAAGISSGEVIVPSLTFAATPHAVVWAGAKPVFAEVKNDGSFSIDPADVESCIGPDTKAIVGVDAYGIACDYEGLARVGEKYGLKVLFDSAPSFGTSVQGVRTGSFGDGQIFSFHATKAFNTMEGGCLCSKDLRIIEAAKAIRNFGQVEGDCAYAGLNGKMTEICAIIGLEQLKRFPSAIANRERCVERIRNALQDVKGLSFGQAPSEQRPVWLYLPMLIDERLFGGDRDELALALSRTGINVRKYYFPPCHKMSVYASISRRPLPITEHISDRVLSLPLYNDMTEEECDRISSAIRTAAQ